MEFIIAYTLRTATPQRLAVMADALSELRAIELWPTVWDLHVEIASGIGAKTVGATAQSINRHLEQYVDAHLAEDLYGEDFYHQRQPMVESMIIARVLSALHVPNLPAAAAIDEGRATVVYGIFYSFVPASDVVQREHQIQKQLHGLGSVPLGEHQWALATKIRDKQRPEDTLPSGDRLSMATIHEQIDSYFLTQDRLIITDIIVGTGLEHVVL